MQRIEYQRFTLGELDTNCYLLWCRETRNALVIDPADNGTFISEQILENQLELTAILLTHGHFDHCLGLLELSLNFTVPIYLHPADLFLIKQAQQNAQHWLKHPVDPVPLPTAELQDGQKLEFGNCSLTVFETPGHTPGSVCLYYKPEKAPSFDEQIIYAEEPILFSGDILFESGFGRTDFRYSNTLQLYDSLEKIKKFPTETVVLSGHGQPFVLGNFSQQGY